MKIKLFLYLFATVIITSCGLFGGKEVSEIDDSETKKFIQNSNANSSWDTTFKYSYELQEHFENTNTLMCFTGNIADIIKKDSTYVLKLNLISENEYEKSWDAIAYVAITQQVKSEILSKMNSNAASTGAFILKVSKIRPSTVGIKADIDGKGDDAFAYLDFDYSANMLLINAELVNYQLDELKNQDE
jgi:hypothetical protein